MKMKKKSKSHQKHQAVRLAVGMQKTREISKSILRMNKPQDTFTPMEIGRPDEDRVPDIHNPQAVQGGLGPLNQDGEGNRQNDQIEELEKIEPKK